MEKLEELKATLIKYYINTGMQLPNSVSEYINSFPKGFSRQVLKSKYNLTTSEVVSLINNNYSKANPRKALEDNLSRLNYSLEGNLLETFKSKDRINVICNLCGYVNNTTLDSLRGSTKGCIKCTSGNLSWNKRENELRELILKNFEGELVSKIPSNQTGFIDIKHIPCGTTYTSQLVGIVSPNSLLRGTCPNCRTTDRRVVLDDITFGSQFEVDCYKVLKPFSPEIHVLYSKYINTFRKWVCDFKIGDTWIEVSNFKVDYKGYFANIQDKQNLVESNGLIFSFLIQ